MNYKIKCINTNRGFFSDLIHGIMPSLIFLSDKNIKKYYVDWESNLYSNTNLNLFEYFFLKTNKLEIYHEELNMGNCPYGTFFEEVNSDEKLMRGNEVIKELKLLESDFIKKIKIPFTNQEKVLGVQHRKTDHGMHVKIIENKSLIKNVENEFLRNSYDKIFLITDDESSLNDFKNHFGNKLLYNECFRSNSNIAIHFHQNLNFDKLKLAEEVLTDSICLSKTNFKMICNSNVSTFSLLANFNKDNYVYIEKL